MPRLSLLVRVLLLILPISALTWFFAEPSTASIQSGTALQLQRPVFVQAQDGTTAIEVAALLDQQAGISAYYRTPGTISLSQVRSQFRTIESETPNYIIGSVAVPNYIEHFDVHVYVDVNGWILAYYPKTDPVAKIVDIKAESTTSTKLRTVVAIIAGAAGAPISDVTYYDFRYPNATHMLMVGESLSGGNDFSIQIPSTYGYFERSWAIHNLGGGPAYFTLDGSSQTSTYAADYVYYGVIAAPQFLPDVAHTITVDDYGILVVLYRVP